MTRYLFQLAVFILIALLGCNSSDSGMEKFSLNCPQLATEKEFVGPDKGYTVKVPMGWMNQHMEPVGDGELNTVVFSDSLAEMDSNGEFKSFHVLGITRVRGEYPDLEKEHEITLLAFSESNPTIHFIGKGKTALLNYDACYTEIEEDSDMGPYHSMMFLIKSETKELEYYVLNATVYGKKETGFKLCQMLDVLKTFEMKN